MGKITGDRKVVAGSQKVYHIYQNRTASRYDGC